MKIETFFFEYILIDTLKLLVYQHDASVNILSIKWIELLTFLIAVICYEIKWNKWIFFYFFILLYYVKFLFYDAFIDN